MKTPGAKTAVGLVGGLAVGTALLVGCSGSTSSGGATGAPSETSTGLTTEQRNYCAAVTTWGTSVAAADVKAAVASGDAERIKTAMRVYSVQTQEMVDSVPADAPDNVKQAYQNINTAIKNSGAGTLTTEQQAAQSASNPIVVAYYAEVCN